MIDGWGADPVGSAGRPGGGVPAAHACAVGCHGSPHRRTQPGLSGDVHRDRRAEPFDRPVKVVTDLQRQPVLAWRQLHIDDVLAVAEMHPRRGARDGRPGGQAVGVDTHVVVAKVRPGFGDRARRHRRDPEILRAELQPHRALDRRAIRRLDKEDPRSCRLRLATRRRHQCDQDHGYCPHNRRSPHSAAECITAPAVFRSRRPEGLR
jgi:hypothetical protein